MSFENSSEIFKLQKLVKSSLLEINKLKMEIAQLKDEQNSLMSNDEFETLKIESEESLKQKENEILDLKKQHEIAISDLKLKYNKVIYMDCDTLIMSDLRPLYDMDVEEYSCLMYQEYNRNHMDEGFKNTILRKDLAVFNSGVILFNVDKFKKYNIDDSSKLKLKPIKSDNKQLLYLMANQIDKMDKSSGIYKNYDCQAGKRV